MTIDSFQHFGVEFQTRVLQGILLDHKFFEKIHDVLKNDYFSVESHTKLWIEIKKYYEKYSEVPSILALRVEINCIVNEELKEICIRTLVEIENNSNRKEVEQAKDKVLEFCKNKSMELAILESVPLLKQGKYDEIQKKIEDALKVSLDIDIGSDYFKSSLNDRYKESSRRCIPTGFESLDHLEFLDGGSGPGELYIIMAPSGGGKSFFLVNIGYGALARGKNVLYYTCELSEKKIMTRYDSRITSIPMKEIKKRKEEAEEKLREFKGGRLIVKEYPTKTATVNTIKFHTNKLMSSLGFKPDLIIVDYADLLKSRKGYDMKRYELEAIYEDLRGMAVEMKLPLWSASQTGRSAIFDEVITEDKIGEAYAKVQIADFIASFSANKFYICKNRDGRARQIFDCKLEESIAKFSLYSPVGMNFNTSNIETQIKSVIGNTDEKSSLNNLYKNLKARKGMA